ncbi:nuclear transport factor 2 family protein [Yinghuangia soli]|uniref:Nuclear transport factor 2 family protein n=1 Tax=Yinghuangia soli TaxID=2908204 RepID=A0AA41U7N9_9ACTN|nr:nuclear transport factor 2 family protein [Yinghuangia soli]MCF2532124.1 nuclear transport factor 2 family protein [Yinghuangia soli]
MSAQALTTDRIDLADLFTRLAVLLDEKRWDDAGTAFTGDVVARSPLGHELHGLDQVIAHMRKGEAVGEHTQHVTTDLLVDVDADGDRAAVSANSLVFFYRDGEPPFRTSGLRLVTAAVRTADGWRIREWETKLLWMREA